MCKVLSVKKCRWRERQDLGGVVATVKAEAMLQVLVATEEQTPQIHPASITLISQPALGRLIYRLVTVHMWHRGSNSNCLVSSWQVSVIVQTDADEKPAACTAWSLLLITKIPSRMWLLETSQNCRRRAKGQCVYHAETVLQSGKCGPGRQPGRWIPNPSPSSSAVRFGTNYLASCCLHFLIHKNQDNKSSYVIRWLWGLNELKLTHQHSGS